ncbi:hypothetical protein ACN6LI_002876 [Streptomyces violaceoruber]
MPDATPAKTAERRAATPWWTRAVPKFTLLTGPATNAPRTRRVPTVAPSARGEADSSRRMASRRRLSRSRPVPATTRARARCGDSSSQGSRSRAVTMRLPGAYSSPGARTDIGIDTGSGGWAEPVSFRYQVRTAWDRAAR